MNDRTALEDLASPEPKQEEHKLPEGRVVESMTLGLQFSQVWELDVNKLIMLKIPNGTRIEGMVTEVTSTHGAGGDVRLAFEFKGRIV